MSELSPIEESAETAGENKGSIEAITNNNASWKLFRRPICIVLTPLRGEPPP